MGLRVDTDDRFRIALTQMKDVYKRQEQLGEDRLARFGAYREYE